MAKHGMIAYGLLVTCAIWAVLWAAGEAIACIVFAPRSSSISSVARLPLGLAATICLLEAAGYFLPIRVAAWLVLPVAAYGAFAMARRPSRVFRDDWALVAASAVGLVLGLWPVAIARRFTAAALTNNDGTYYIGVADWLERVPWSVEHTSWGTVPPAQCFTERVLHLWHWRTGTPNLMAAVSSLSGLGSTQALAIVTAVLFASIPCAAIGIARGLGLRQHPGRELLIGIVSACAAAAAFLGYQHMTGHLGAQSIFLVASGAALGVVRHGGLRRELYGALFFGAGVAMFADGASVLVVIAFAALVAGGRRIGRSAARLGALAGLTVAVAPFSILRAAHAAWNTYAVRLPSSQAVFPQRGWLPRHILDDLATFVGVDPWPPWPAAWPPDSRTSVTWLGALCGCALLGYGSARLRARHGERVMAGVLGISMTIGFAVVGLPYLKGKLLMMAAAFAVPMSAIGAASVLGRARLRFLIVPFFVAELFALGELGRPSRWKVVDGPDHDALVAELARLPAGSLVAFDGLGAPADEVLDSHRAHRAALLANLRPVQPGLDGGFYVRLCKDVERPNPLPPHAYALQRVTSETLTHGKLLSSWGRFRLLEADLTNPEGLIASWAPTHGWLTSERDAEGRIFRWAEWQAQGTLHAVMPARCARLRGDLRVVAGAALVGIWAADHPVFEGSVAADWTPFETRPFAVRDPVAVRFEVLQSRTEPPDVAHAVAVSRLSVDPVPSCGTSVRFAGGADEIDFPVEFAERLDLSLGSVGATGPCSRVAVTIAGESGTTVSLTVDDGPPARRSMAEAPEVVETAVRAATEPHRVTIMGDGPKAGLRYRVLGAVITPQPCAR